MRSKEINQGPTLVLRYDDLSSQLDKSVTWQVTANPTWGDIFERFFQSSKLKARTSLFTETWQKRRSSFELWALSFDGTNSHEHSTVQTVTDNRANKTWKWRGRSTQLIVTGMSRLTYYLQNVVENSPTPQHCQVEVWPLVVENIAN